MDFPHQRKILTAVHPFYGPANSLSLQRQIRADGLDELGMPEVVSFVDEYFGGKGPQAEDVNQIMKKRYFRAFTGILYNPEKRGWVTFTERPVFNDGSIIDRDNLIQRVKKGDFYSHVSLAKAREGEIDWKKVAKHPYLRAFAGEEGAEKLARIASLHPTKAVYLFVPNVSGLKEPIARAAGLVSLWNGSTLGVDGCDHGDGGYSYAFGMRRDAAEDSALEKPTLVPEFRDASLELIAQVRSAREEMYCGGLGEIPDRLRVIGRNFSELRETASQYSGVAHQEASGYLNLVQNSVGALYQELEEIDKKR